jgi:hypothetical protein
MRNSNGKISYTYHHRRTAAGVIAMREAAREDPGVAAHAERLHASMEKISKSNSAIRAYLEAAPADLTYAALRSLLVSTQW